MSECRWPDHSLLIDPQGYLKPCCMISGKEIEQAIKLQNLDKEELRIETADDMNEFVYSDLSRYIRNELDDKGIDKAEICHRCKMRTENGDNTHAAAFEDLNPNHKEYVPGEVSYLEFTTSNICNQTCITCSSYFSSKWKTIEHLFGQNSGQNHSLSDADIDKIIQLLPTIKTLHIKGGEPFSDLRNAKILSTLADVNPNCHVWITSNVSIISNKFLNILKRFKSENVHMIASMDHIGKKYEWIRGTPFEQSLETLKKLHLECGIIPRALPTLSYFNVLDIWEIHDFYTNFEHVDIAERKEMNAFNILMTPREMNYFTTRTQEELDTVMPGLKSEFDPIHYAELQRKIEIMNGIRGFRWQDC